jgi:hypothetical protein
MQGSSAKFIEPDEFRRSDIAFRQGTSLFRKPKPKFISGAKGSEDLWLRFPVFVEHFRGRVQCRLT